MPETRPRLTFNENGVCSACVWSERKQDAVAWEKRSVELEALCSKHRNRNKGRFDVICPVSGGKDSSYVAYMLKHHCGMHPLCITLKPPLTLALGELNLRTFVEYGYDHLHIT